MALGDQDLTSANSVITLMIPNQVLFPLPINLQGFSADRIFETDAVEMAETVMGVDGRLSAGFVPNPVDQTFTMMPDSPSWVQIDAVINAQRINRALYRFNGTISIPSISRRYTMSYGVLRTSSFIPGAARMLEARTFSIRWQSAIATPTA